MEGHTRSNNVQGHPPPAAVPQSKDWTLGYWKGYNEGLRSNLSSSLQAIPWNRPQSEPVTSFSSQEQMYPQASTLSPCYCSGTPSYSMQPGLPNLNTHASGLSRDLQWTEAAAQVSNYRALLQHSAADYPSSSALVEDVQADLGTSMVDLVSWDHAVTRLESETQGGTTLQQRASRAFIPWNTSFYGDVHPRLYSPSQHQNGLGIAAASHEVPLVSLSRHPEQYSTYQAPTGGTMHFQQGGGRGPLSQADDNIAAPQVLDPQGNIATKVSTEETEAPPIGTHETIGIPSGMENQVFPDSPGDTTRASSPAPSCLEEDDNSIWGTQVPPLEDLLASIPGRKRHLSPSDTSERGQTAKRRATDH